MIWYSALLMTVIDVVMVLGTLKALQILFRHRATILGMKVARPVQAIVAGLCIICGLYLADSYTMLVMPLYASDEAVMAAMRNLHLNWSWLVVLAGFAAIVAGLVYLVAKLFPQIATIIKSLEAEVAERGRVEDELLRRERLATLGQLTATVSHELRNPLGVIRTSAFILRDGLKEEMPRARRALERVERSVMRCDRIIDELLDFTRMPDLKPEPTALDDWLAGVLEEQSLPTGISLRQELQLPETTVALDRDRFRRAVINVFDNACQAMLGKGEAETEPAERVLTVRTRERAGRIEVVFDDRGPGIPPQVYERIFEPLYSTKGFGVGLGLPVVKQIMERHGGGIEIETEEGRGTAVCLWLDRNAPAEHVAA